LSEALWAHRISKHRATKVSPFELVYGQEVVLHVEISLNVVRFAKRNDLTIDDYYNLMMDNIDEVSDKRVQPRRNRKGQDHGHQSLQQEGQG
jgi:hypothetical protein